MKIHYLSLGFLTVGIVAAGWGIDSLLPARETTYKGYSAAAVSALERERLPMTRRYARLCAVVGQSPVVEEVYEVSGLTPARTVSYQSAGAGALGGVSRETGLRGWAGLFTPPEKAAGVDQPAGDYSDCNLVSRSGAVMLFPGAILKSGAHPTAPPTSDSISWEARAKTAKEGIALEQMYEAARAEVKPWGTPWRESTSYAVSPAGARTLLKGAFRFRHLDGSQLTMEFERVAGDPLILAMLVAHRRLPTQAAAPADED